MLTCQKNVTKLSIPGNVLVLCKSSVLENQFVPALLQWFNLVCSFLRKKVFSVHRVHELLRKLNHVIP